MTAGVAQLLGPGVAQLGGNVGGAAVVGGLVGWAAKKLLKVVAVLVGVELALLAFLAKQGVITVDWSQLSSIMTGVKQTATQAPSVVATGAAAMGIGVGFIGGFSYGFHKG